LWLWFVAATPPRSTSVAGSGIGSREKIFLIDRPRVCAIDPADRPTDGAQTAHRRRETADRRRETAGRQIER
jgi:hypothetical protein